MSAITEDLAVRKSTVDWVDISNLEVSESAQRVYDPAHAASIAMRFDWEAFGMPVVNIRSDGRKFLVDGQHRVAAVRIKFPEITRVQCEVYEGLTEAEEAELFLLRDERRAVRVLDKWRIAQTAGRETELRIAEIVADSGLKISSSPSEGSIRAVGTLKRIYTNYGENVLARTLFVIREAYGHHGFGASVMHGLAMMIARYSTAVEDRFLIEKLGNVHGGIRGLTNRAEVLHRQTGQPMITCVAAAAVDIHNGGRGGAKLAPWWKQRVRDSHRGK